MKMKDNNEPVFGASDKDLNDYKISQISYYNHRLMELRQTKSDLVRKAMEIENAMADCDSRYSAIREEILNKANQIVGDKHGDLELASELIKLAGD